ncbi:MAG: UDP-2,4-diacetamido-2,4,6-trideoxy-beta-L-altropyranose hydrolase [Candidatus Sumerlaeia bacterium]|nr:UDP-2,4-diacetamido-2,4,6-trideoxy-beta-L-altropyranose hydrolase [Candidatus Sumerlaeia bacterium]
MPPLRKVLIRADASPDIGLGHVMRSLALARALAAKRREVVFASRAATGIAQQLIEAAGFPHRQLSADLRESVDAEGTLAAAKAEGAGMVVVDHYGAGAEWYRRVGTELPLAVIDDFGDPAAAEHAALVLNQSPAADASIYRDKPLLLCGARYAMLRDSIVDLRIRRKARGCDSDTGRVLVTYGGADPRGMTPRIVEALRGLAAIRKLVVVTGPAYRQREAMAALVSEIPGAEYRHAVPDLTTYLVDADVAVTAGGTTLHEAMCIGVPCVVIEAASNQHGQIVEHAQAGAIKALGPVDRFEAAALRAAVEELLADPAARSRMAHEARTIVDGYGAQRVAEGLLNSLRRDVPILHSTPGIQMRPASMDDAELLLNWRNDPLTRLMSLSADEVTLEEHLRWLEGTLKRTDRELLIGEFQGEAVGLGRHDYFGQNDSLLNINMNSLARGRGFAVGLLGAAMRWPAAKRGPTLIHGHVFPENSASQRMVQQNGMARHGYVKVRGGWAVHWTRLMK